MCLLVLAWQAHPRYRFVLAANRDEYHDRPSAPLAKWDASDGIIAGRDLRAGGTWLGVDAQRRVGVITNFRDLQRPRPGSPSRGALIPSYLRQPLGPHAFLEALAPRAADYSGFNLLLADADALWYASNRSETLAQPLTPGVYGLSNQLLDTPWPKLARVRKRFEEWLRAPSASPEEDLFAMLNDRKPADRRADSPPSSLPADLERALSAPFVLHPTYGTRCSTVVLVESSAAMRIAERSFDADGEPSNSVAFER